MLLELINLLTVLQNQLGKKAELDNKFFENFISPIWGKFNEIHDDYKLSFNRYFEIATREEFDFQNLVDVIYKDSSYTKDLRSDLRNMRVHIPKRGAKVNIALSNFLTAIDMYFEINKYFPYSFVLQNNRNWVFLDDTSDDEVFYDSYFENTAWKILSEKTNPLKVKAFSEISDMLKKSENLEFHSSEVNNQLYLEYCSKGLITEQSYENGSRQAVIFALGINDTNSKERAKRILDYVFAKIQNHYHETGRHFFTLKAEFLS